MSAPVVAIIPFCVPNTSIGMGFGLAHLMHMLVKVNLRRLGSKTISAESSETPAILQIYSQHKKPIETFVPSSAYSQVMPEGDKTPQIVFSGSLKPSEGGLFEMKIVAFYGESGVLCAEHDWDLRDEYAGLDLLTGLTTFCEKLNDVHVDLELLRGLELLPWDSLSSLLLAESHFLTAKTSGQPNHLLPAFMCLERALLEKEASPFLLSRLCDMAACEIAALQSIDFQRAICRTLRRVLTETQHHEALVNACCLAEIRSEFFVEAETRARAALHTYGPKASFFARLAEAKFMLGDLFGAEQAVDEGLSHIKEDVYLLLLKARIYRARQQPNDALRLLASLWQTHLGFLPLFFELAELSLENRFETMGAILVDWALSLPGMREQKKGPSLSLTSKIAHQAYRLCSLLEPDGEARTTRLTLLS